MDAYMILFRIIHIASAMLWFGAAVFYTAFIGPPWRDRSGGTPLLRRIGPSGKSSDLLRGRLYDDRDSGWVPLLARLWGPRHRLDANRVRRRPHHRRARRSVLLVPSPVGPRTYVIPVNRARRRDDGRGGTAFEKAARCGRDSVDTAQLFRDYHQRVAGDRHAGDGVSPISRFLDPQHAAIQSTSPAVLRGSLINQEYLEFESDRPPIRPSGGCQTNSRDKYRSSLGCDLRDGDLALRSSGARQLLQRLRTKKREGAVAASESVVGGPRSQSSCCLPDPPSASLHW
jgi:hypothetical protein